MKLLVIVLMLTLYIFLCKSGLKAITTSQFIVNDFVHRQTNQAPHVNRNSGAILAQISMKKVLLSIINFYLIFTDAAQSTRLEVEIENLFSQISLYQLLGSCTANICQNE
jgi:hypothetical protein